MNKSESIANLAAALVKAQAEIPAAKFDATNPFLKNKYASLGAIIEAARPHLAKHGLSVTQFPVNEDFQIGLTTVLLHASGEWMSSTLTLPVTDEKGKSTAQVAGSVISYLRRYALASVLGIYADEDTDGHTEAKKVEPKKAEPVAQPSSLMTIEMASEIKGHDGKLYKDLTTKELSYRHNEIEKKIEAGKLTDEARAEAQMKIDAIRVILADRQT